MGILFKIVKILGSLAISIGVGTVTKNVIKSTTPSNTKKIASICIGIGSYFIAGLASVAASKQFEENVDKIEKTVIKISENTSTKEVEGNEA